MRSPLFGISAAALTLAGPVAAHVTVAPSFVAARDTQEFVFAAPNERDAPMTGFSVTVPKGFEIVDADHQPDWHPVVLGSKVIWSGGSLPAGNEATFKLALKGRPAPGAVQLTGDQLYASGAVVHWPVAFTVVPGTKPSEHFGPAAIVAGSGLVFTIVFVAVAWRRRAPALRER